MDRVLCLISLLAVLGACGGGALKGQGEECFGTAECDVGLVCNTTVEPAVCTPGLDMLPPDAPLAPPVDGAPGPDADPNTPDAAVVTPDAAVLPDAALPDAALPDAALPDATPPDAAM